MQERMQASDANVSQESPTKNFLTRALVWLISRVDRSGVARGKGIVRVALSGPKVLKILCA